MLSFRTYVLLMAAAASVPLVWKFVLSDPLTPTVKARMHEFETAINREIETVKPLCTSIYGPFPRSPFFNNYPCKPCEAFESAGMLEFRDGKYHLLKSAQPYYSRDRTGGYSQFCFGEVRVHKIIESLPVDRNLNWLSVKYVPEIRSPAPFLFTSEARAMGFPEPLQAKGAEHLWVGPPQIITFYVGSDGVIGPVWSGSRYGKFALESEEYKWH